MQKTYHSKKVPGLVLVAIEGENPKMNTYSTYNEFIAH